MHSLSCTTHIYKIDERRKKVASLLARSMTGQSTISRDVRALKEMSQRFVYDLAESDLGYYYKQSIDGIGEVKSEAGKIFNDPVVPVREKLLAFKIIIQSDETRFKLLTEGPSVMNMKTMEDRLNRLENI
jgi:hypothetical protein